MVLPLRDVASAQRVHQHRGTHVLARDRLPERRISRGGTEEFKRTDVLFKYIGTPYHSLLHGNALRVAYSVSEVFEHVAVFLAQRGVARFHVSIPRSRYLGLKGFQHHSQMPLSGSQFLFLSHHHLLLIILSAAME